MKECASTMPELSENRAPTDRTWGSAALACAPVRRSSRTPFAAAAASIRSSAGRSASSTAVMSFPSRRWGTSCAAQSA